jgi:hypothetical protein
MEGDICSGFILFAWDIEVDVNPKWYQAGDCECCKKGHNNGGDI